MNEERQRVYKKLGNRIKTLRIQKGLSRKQMAQKCGVTVATYARWENGQTILRVVRLYQLIIALNVTPNELFDLNYILS